MKVLHVVYNCYPDETGAAVRTRYLVQTQARLGLCPVVLSSPFQPPADPVLHHGVEYFHGIPHYRCYNGSDPARFMAAGKSWQERAVKLLELVPFARRIREVALGERIDVIHAHSLVLCGLAAVAAGRSLGLPVVYEVRSLIEEGMDGAGPLARSAYRALERLTCRLASHVTVVCEGLRRELMRRGVAETKLTVVGNGVDLDAHRPVPGGERTGERVARDTGTPVFGEGRERKCRGVAETKGFNLDAHRPVPGGEPTGELVARDTGTPVAGEGREMKGRGVAETKGFDLDAGLLLPGDGRAGEFVAGYIGTLVPYEGLDLLLDAAARLAPRHPQLRVLLVGDGNARAALEQQARRLGLDGAVRFAGRVPHDFITSYYEAIDLFVLPRRAGRITDAVTPLKPLEIMAHGKALLAGDCGGHRELIIDGVNGALFRTGDAADLARRIEEWIAAPGLLSKLGGQARAWVEEHRSWEKQCRPVIELYRRLASRPAPGVLLVAPAPGRVPTGGVENVVGLILRSKLAERYRICVWDRHLGRRFLRFAARVALRRPGVIHIKSSSGVNFVESAIYAAISRLLGRRVLFQLHSGDFEAWYNGRSGPGRWAIRHSLRWSHQILVLSECWRDLMTRLVPSRPIQIVPNGVEIPAAAPHPDGVVLRVLTIATLGRHKGHFTILDAASRLRGCPIRFLLAGPDETSGRGDGKQIRLRAGELGLGESVEFLGPVGPEQKWDLLANADVFLLPSHAEGMPNAVLEAMAAGLPVVATPVGALPEMLPDGVFVNAGDPEDLARALLSLHQEPARRHALGRQNRARVEARYSLTRFEQLLDALYR